MKYEEFEDKLQNCTDEEFKSLHIYEDAARMCDTVEEFYTCADMIAKEKLKREVFCGNLRYERETCAEILFPKGKKNSKLKLGGAIFNLTRNALELKNDDGYTLTGIADCFISPDGCLVHLVGKRYEEIYRGRIIISKYIVNIDDLTVKCLVEFKNIGGNTISFTLPKADLFDTKKIKNLANRGVLVYPYNARLITGYLQALDTSTVNVVNWSSETGKIGWITQDELKKANMLQTQNRQVIGYLPEAPNPDSDEKTVEPNSTYRYIDFVPFSYNIGYAGYDRYKKEYASLTGYRGTCEDWVALLKPFRDAEHKLLRIVLAASFASVLVEPMECLPFIVHLWGTTGKGKSVALMTAASVWAKPDLGQNAYIKSFNATDKGLLDSIQFYGNLPLCIDELQTQGNRQSFDTLIYMLTEGAPRLKAKTKDKEDITHEWRNAIITTGEQPIVSDKSHGGSLNRVIDLNLSEAILSDDSSVMNAFCGTLRNNCGTAGEAFVKKLLEPHGLEEAYGVYTHYRNELTLHGTGKQAASMALILTADSLTAKWIYKDTITLSVEDVLPYIKTEKDVDNMAKVNDMVNEYIASNPKSFDDDCRINRYGKIYIPRGETERCCAFLPSKLDDLMDKFQVSRDAYLTWASRNGYLLHDGERDKVSVKINNVYQDGEGNYFAKAVRCYVIKLKKDEDEDITAHPLTCSLGNSVTG